MEMAETVECIAALLESCLASVIIHYKQVGIKAENQKYFTLNYIDTLWMSTYIAICYVIIGCLHLLSGICHGFLGKTLHYFEVSKTLILVD